MDLEPNNKVSKVTAALKAEYLQNMMPDQSEPTYLPVPNKTPDPDAPVWRVKFEPLVAPHAPFGLDINGDFILGRNSELLNLLKLDEHDANQLGMSRYHAQLHPSATQLYITDLESTNGTWRNGHSIGVNTPYSLQNRDLLRLGQLELIVHIIKQPKQSKSQGNQTSTLKQQSLRPIIHDITSQLSLDDVFKQALKYTCSLPAVDHASIWLIDESTGSLLLEAEQSTQNDDFRQMRLSIQDKRVAEVIATGEPLRISRAPHEGQLKINTGYLADAVIYVPLMLGKITFGVLCATHRTVGMSFKKSDESAMTTIADVTAIAIQNARLYNVTNMSLTRRSKVVTALNYILSYDIKRELNASLGYVGMLGMTDDLTDESSETVEQLLDTITHLAAIIEKLIEITGLYNNVQFKRISTNLLKIAEAVAHDMKEQATAKDVELSLQVTGNPYLIAGDPLYLYRSISNLVDNAIKFSPAGARVIVNLDFWPEKISLTVADEGPGIDKADLPYLIDRYYHGTLSPDGRSGLGLGLELVRATIDEHKGTLSAKNLERAGAQFTITLPGTLRIQ